MVKVLGYSRYINAYVLGPPQRGLVHSSFASATNLAFGTDFFLSLNALPEALLASPDLLHKIIVPESGAALPLLPNGVLLSTQASMFPFGSLQPGMAVVLGVGRLWLESLACSLDLSTCFQWNSRIEHSGEVLIKEHIPWLQQLCDQQRATGIAALAIPEGQTILALAYSICGRGAGLTPGGDDFLLGWLAAGWFLYGARPDFLARGQSIVEIAEQRTHALSRYWLSCAATGYVAQPVKALLEALTRPEQQQLEQAAHNLLAMGSTSGSDTLRGILYAIMQSPL
jgi:hypothetical protein